MLKKLFTLTILTILFYFPVNAQEDLDKVVNPKTNGSGYVSNADHIISQTAVNQLNSLIRPLDQQYSIFFALSQ